MYFPIRNGILSSFGARWASWSCIRRARMESDPVNMDWSISGLLTPIRSSYPWLVYIAYIVLVIASALLNHPTAGRYKSQRNNNGQVIIQGFEQWIFPDEVYETLLSGSGGGQGTYDMYILFWLLNLYNISCVSFRLSCKYSMGASHMSTKWVNMTNTRCKTSVWKRIGCVLIRPHLHPQRITKLAEKPLSNENVPNKIHWMINNNSQTMVGLGTKVGW